MNGIKNSSFDGVCLHTWKVNTKEIKLIENKNQLYYLALEAGKIIYQNPPFSLDERTFKAAKIYFPRCEVIPLTKNQYDFCPVLLKKKINKLRLSLIRSRNGLVWQLFDKTKKTKEWQSFSATFVSNKCHQETWEILENLKQEAAIDTIFKENFEIKDVVRVTGGNCVTKARKDGLLEEDNEPIGNRLRNNEYDLQERLNSYFKKHRKISKKNKKKEQAYIVSKKILKYQSLVITKQFIVCLKKKEGKSCKVTLTEEDITLRWKDAFVNYIFTDSLKVPPLEKMIKDLKHYKFLKKINIRYRKFQFISETNESRRSKKNLLTKNEVLSKEGELFVKTLAPFYIVVEPKAIPSVIDSNILLSKNRWTSYIATVNGKCGHHAELIVEGVNDGFFPEETDEDKKPNPKEGERFLYLMHLEGPNKIDHKLLEKFHYKTRSLVWTKPSDKVKKMIKSVIKESANPIIKFSSYGCNSIFSGGAHNCITWAREKLKDIDVNLSRKILGFIATTGDAYSKSESYHKKHPIKKQI